MLKKRIIFFGKIGNVVLMQIIGVKEEKFMRKKFVKYTNEPIGKLRIIFGLLPRPKNLILKGKKVKITFSLMRENVDLLRNMYFKRLI